MIEINNLKKFFGKTTAENYVVALNDINLKINTGEFIGIVGESGSGKSTLLNLIGALDTPTSGNIVIDGEEITKFNEKEAAAFRKKNIGFVFQNFYLEQDFTVVQNVEIPLMLQGVAKNKRKQLAIDSLNSLGLNTKLNCNINQLSGGQMQRVCIARALVHCPKIILADEPTGNLDTKNGQLVIEQLKELKKKNITIILVTHNLHEAQSCDRLIVLKDGIIEVLNEV